MRKLLCKIWNFILGLVTDLVDLVVDTVQKIAKLILDIIVLAVDVIGDIVDEVGDAVFGEGGFKKAIFIGLGAWILVAWLGRDKEQPQPRQMRDVAPETPTAIEIGMTR